MKRSDKKEFDEDASEHNHQAYMSGVEEFKRGQFKAAAKVFSEALEYWPEDPQAWFALGNCHDELNRPAKAERCFRKSLKFSEPDKRSDILYNLGNSLLDQSKFLEAIECYIKVPAQSSAYSSAQTNMERAKNGNPRKNS